MTARTTCPALALALAIVAGAPAPARASGDESLQVFDQEAYDTSVAPAYGTYETVRDPGPLLALMRSTIQRIRAKELPARSLRGEDAVAVLRRAVVMLQGDTSQDDAHLVRTLEGRPLGRDEALQHMVKTSVLPLLLDVLCVHRFPGGRAALDLWSSPLAPHLYPRSPWIRQELDGESPAGEGGFAQSRCAATTALQPWWVARFERELRGVPKPADRDAAKDRDLLLRMLELVRKRPALRLVIERC